MVYTQKKKPQQTPFFSFIILRKLNIYQKLCSYWLVVLTFSSKRKLIKCWHIFNFISYIHLFMYISFYQMTYSTNKYFTEEVIVKRNYWGFLNLVSLLFIKHFNAFFKKFLNISYLEVEQISNTNKKYGQKIHMRVLTYIDFISPKKYLDSSSKLKVTNSFLF